LTAVHNKIRKEDDKEEGKRRERRKLERGKGHATALATLPQSRDRTASIENADIFAQRRSS